MNALAKLGLELDESIPIDILLGENFNSSLYGLTLRQAETVRALRQVVAEYNSGRSSRMNVAVTDSSEAVSLVTGTLTDLEHEEVWVAFLTSANKVISTEMVFRGTIDSVPISPRPIIAKALSLNASNMIMFHNHPSGSVQPSRNDINVTSNIKKACTLMELGFLDHIIVTRDEAYSFADEVSFPLRK